MKSNAKSLLKIWAVVLALLLSQEHGHAKDKKTPAKAPVAKGKTSPKATANASTNSSNSDSDSKGASEFKARIDKLESLKQACVETAKESVEQCKARIDSAILKYTLDTAATDSDDEAEKKNCKEAVTKFNEENGKFNEAATAAGGKSSLTAIGQAIVCTSCTGGKGAGVSYCDEDALAQQKKEEEEQRRKDRETKKAITAPSSQTNSATSKIGLTKSKAALVSCPSLASSYAKELGEKITKAKEDDRKNEDELGKLIESLQENQAKKESVKNEAQEDVSKLEEKKQEELEKLEENATEETKRLRKEYDEATDAISQIMDKLLPAVYEKHRAQITAIELECEQQAYKKLEEYLTARRGLLNSSKLGTDSFLKLARQTGPTRKEKNAAIAEEHYDACTSGGMFNAKKKQIDNELAFSVKDMESKVASLRQTMYKKMEEISGSERQNAYMKKLKKIESSYSTKIETIKTKAMAEYQALEAKGQKIQEDIKKLQLRMDESKSRMAMMTSLYAAASAGSSGGEDDSDKHKKFLSTFGVFRTVANHAFESCKCNDKDASIDKTACKSIKAITCAVRSDTEDRDGCDGDQMNYIYSTPKDDSSKGNTR